MTAGRPSDYQPKKTIKAVEAYLKQTLKKKQLPTIEGLAVHLGVWRSTLYDWADNKSAVYHPEFHDIFEKLKALQADQLIQGGVKGVYNATITKLMLTKHDYYDKQDVTSKGEKLPGTALSNLTDEQLVAIAGIAK